MFPRQKCHTISLMPEQTFCVQMDKCPGMLLICLLNKLSRQYHSVSLNNQKIMFKARRIVASEPHEKVGSILKQFNTSYFVTRTQGMAVMSMC